MVNIRDWNSGILENSLEWTTATIKKFGSHRLELSSCNCLVEE